MKYLFLAIPLFSALLACNDDDSASDFDQATITQPDYRLCPCCGGWFIQIETDTYRFNELPPGANISLHPDSLPVEVLLTWEFVTDPVPCAGDIIEILQIEKK